MTVDLAYDALPSADETLRVTFKLDRVFDLAGNPLPWPMLVGNIFEADLNDQRPPAFSAVALADNTILITFTEAVGPLTIMDFETSLSGGRR